MTPANMTPVRAARTLESAMLQGLWVVPLAQALEARGIAAATLFRHAGIDLERVRVEGVKISSADFDQVWKQALETTGDPLLGLDIANYIRPGTLGSAGYAITASVSLADAFERLRNHQRLLASTMIVDVRRDEGEITLTVRASDPNQNCFRNLSFFAALLKLWRDMSRRDLVPLRVELGMRLPPSERARYLARLEDYFGCPVMTTPGPRYRMTFAAQDALARLPAANADLAERLDDVARQVLGTTKDQSLAGRVTAAIIERLPSGTPTLSDTASDLNVTARTLQRRLMEEGLSYRELLDGARKQLAEGYVQSGQRTQKEIAFLLGFADVSHFSRAFKSWFGYPPGRAMAR